MHANRYVKGVYVDTLEVIHPITKEEVRINVWLNPETNKLFGLTNMEVDATVNFGFDPYQESVGIVFENTFSGLPK